MCYSNDRCYSAPSSPDRAPNLELGGTKFDSWGGGLMAGFNSPSILFLNTWDKPERDWNGNLFRQAPASGYTRYVELYAGAFANCMVAVENGWKKEHSRTVPSQREQEEIMADVDTSQEMTIADGLVIKWVDVVNLKEQDLNAQVMEPRKFDALTQNIKLRGMLESLPYCSQPNGEGPISIVSGHHRTRAAARAGIQRIPVIVDTKPMTRSTITAKQIAANELTGHADEKLLAQLVTQMDNVDDLLLSGLDQDSLPHVEPQQVNLNGLNVKYEYKDVEFLFLTREYEELEQFVDDCNSDMLGLVPMELYDEFVHQVTSFASRNGIKNMAAAVSKIIEIARKDAEEE